jgi:hypothetical protein
MEPFKGREDGTWLLIWDTCGTCMLWRLLVDETQAHTQIHIPTVCKFVGDFFFCFCFFHFSFIIHMCIQGLAHFSPLPPPPPLPPTPPPPLPRQYPAETILPLGDCFLNHIVLCPNFLQQPMGQCVVGLITFPVSFWVNLSSPTLTQYFTPWTL